MQLRDEKEYFEIVDDVTLECSEFGKVLAVEIPRPGVDADESDVGFAFVEYQNIEGAGAARKVSETARLCCKVGKQELVTCLVLS